MKILVVSDTHGSFYELKKAITAEKPIDVLIHCGDICGNLAHAIGARPGYHVYAVRGNCDNRSSLPIKICIPIEGHRVFATHGHYYDVKHDVHLDLLYHTARVEQADIILFGHTHRAFLEERDGVLLLNPGPCGSLSASYGRLFLEQGEVYADIVRVSSEQ